MQWRMLQQEHPSDYVISSGRQETVRRFVELTAKSLGWNKNAKSNGIIWEGEGINEIGRREDNGQIVIRIDPKYFRPSEVNSLLGDPSKAQKELGWVAKTNLESLVKEMVEEDLNIAKKENLMIKEGLKKNFI